MTTFSNVSEFERTLDSIDIDLGTGRVLTVRYAGATNTQYRNAMASYFFKHRRAIENNTHPLEKTDTFERQAYARHVVTGWRGFMNGAGEVPFSAEACAALFEQAPALFEQVREEAQRLANFREDDLSAGEDALKKH